MSTFQLRLGLVKNSSDRKFVPRWLRKSGHVRQLSSSFSALTATQTDAQHRLSTAQTHTQTPRDFPPPTVPHYPYQHSQLHPSRALDTLFIPSTPPSTMPSTYSLLLSALCCPLNFISCSIFACPPLVVRFCAERA